MYYKNLAKMKVDGDLWVIGDIFVFDVVFGVCVCDSYCLLNISTAYVAGLSRLWKVVHCCSILLFFALLGHLPSLFTS